MQTPLGNNNHHNAKAGRVDNMTIFRMRVHKEQELFPYKKCTK